MFASRIFRFTSILFLSTGAIAGNQHPSKRSTGHKDHAIHARQSRTFTLTDNYEGQSFFDNFEFDTFNDPTHGLVDYVSRDDAFGAGLAYVRDDGVAIMKVDDTTQLNPGDHRKSVRIHTKKSWTQGLFISDIVQMPYGCSVWPAFWSNGPDWPQFGEIDVIEGVHNTTRNSMTLHTSPGCTLDDSKSNPDQGLKVADQTFQGNVQTTVCDANVAFNTGCGIRDNGDNSYGVGLNNAGGGAYAVLWDDSGIRIWFFPRGQIPDDIQSKNPNPDLWPVPQAFFSADTCSMAEFFKDHVFIYNITLCGDLGDATFSSAGCQGTCADTVADPANMQFAKWKVNYFRVYN